MKKLIYIAMTALALTSCQTEEVIEEPDVIDSNIDVPIEDQEVTDLLNKYSFLTMTVSELNQTYSLGDNITIEDERFAIDHISNSDNAGNINSNGGYCGYFVDTATTGATYSEHFKKWWIDDNTCETTTNDFGALSITNGKFWMTFNFGFEDRLGEIQIIQLDPYQPLGTWLIHKSNDIISQETGYYWFNRYTLNRNDLADAIGTLIETIKNNPSPVSSIGMYPDFEADLTAETFTDKFKFDWVRLEDDNEMITGGPKMDRIFRFDTRHVNGFYTLDLLNQFCWEPNEYGNTEHSTYTIIKNTPDSLITQVYNSTSDYTSKWTWWSNATNDTIFRILNQRGETDYPDWLVPIQGEKLPDCTE